MTTRTGDRVLAGTPGRSSAILKLFIGAIALSSTLLLGTVDSTAGETTPSPKDAKLEIISPVDGATVSSPVVVKFGLAGMGVAPAGVEHANTGHHHLIVDSPLPKPEFAIPKDDKHQHFGGGQTQVSIELSPGIHTLQLLLGDHRHIPHGPPVSSEIVSILVK